MKYGIIVRYDGFIKIWVDNTGFLFLPLFLFLFVQNSANHADRDCLDIIFLFCLHCGQFFCNIKWKKKDNFFEDEREKDNVGNIYAENGGIAEFVQKYG